MNKWLNFGGDPDYRLDTGIVFSIRHYWECEIRKMVNGHKSAAHADSPDGGTGKMCLGGGMHCPSASSYTYALYRVPSFYFALPAVVQLRSCKASNPYNLSQAAHKKL